MWVRWKKRRELTTLALTKSPSLKHSPILILSRSVNLISANLITPVNSSDDSGTGRSSEIWIWRWAWVGARRDIVPITYSITVSWPTQFRREGDIRSSRYRVFDHYRLYQQRSPPVIPCQLCLDAI